MTRLDVLARERLLDDRHHWHEFESFWRDGPAAFVFVRQFGSPFALEQARAVSEHYDEITATGADVAFIGLGEPIQAFTFRKRAQTRFTVLATRDQPLYRTVGLSRSHLASRGPQNLLPLLRLMRSGTFPYQRTGDIAQLGGAFVVARGGREVVWEHRSASAAVVAPAQDICDALVRAAQPGATVNAVDTGQTP